MANNEPLRYTESEVRSFLPSGWDLVGDAQGSWDDKKQTWRATVIDNVEFDYPVIVPATEAAKLGRLEALRRAMDRVYRERLG
ncbi:MAG TPA: hypothetical protein VMM92_04550 [Thermoanaerobaculia bacterium]|nr:hypothetical protein [Thermoanaerobaculia bacterium]